MADIGSATVRVTPNMTGIQSKIAAGFKGSAGPATQALGDEVEKNSGPFQAAIGKLGGFAKAGGIAIAAGFAAGAAGLVALTKKSLMAGAELEQQLGGAEAVFGDFAGNIKAAAQTAYTEAGLSQNEFLQGANKMGSLFQGAGFTVEQSMEMVIASMQRASDIASIMGIDTTAALEAVTGMAKGNFTMMDNLGVAMNDTSLNAYALEKGLGKTTAQMSIQEKVGLAQQLFLEKTAKYAGNYAKENDTLAGSINTTKKAFDDFLATGDVEGFVETMVKTIKIAVPQIIALLPKLIDGITQIFTTLVPALAEALPTLIPALITAVTSLITSLVAAMPTIVQALLAALPLLINAFIQLFLAIVQALPQIIRQITEALPEIIKAIIEGLTNPETIQSLILAAVELLLAIVEAIPQIVTALIEALPTIIENIITTLTSADFIKQMIEGTIKLFLGMITAIPKIIIALVKAIPQIITSIIDAFTKPETIQAMADAGGELIKGLWNGIKDLAGWIGNKIKDFAGGIVDGIKGFFGIHSPSTVFAEIGENLNKGLAEGLDSSAGLVTKSMNNMTNDALMAVVDPTISPNVAFGSSVAGFTPNSPAGGNTTSTTTIGTVVLGDASAVQEFFKQLNQDTISVGMGLTPNQGALS